MEAIFIKAYTELLQFMEEGMFNYYIPCSTSDIHKVKVMEILQDLCLCQHYSNEFCDTPLLDGEFWEKMDLTTLRVFIVSDGAFLYVDTGRHDLGSAIEHQQLISFVDQYSKYMEEMFVNGNVIAIEASDPAQDWISQQMIKPHVKVLKEMLKFTDIQIKDGLENLHQRDEEISFPNLLDTLVLTEDAVVNVYVGTRKYAFSADVKLVLHECFDRYQREPTMQEFDQEWNRIKGTGIEHLINLVDIEKARAEQADNRANRAHREKLEAMRQTNTAMEDRNEAQQLMNAAIEEIIQGKNREDLLVDRSQRAEEEKRRAEEEKRRAEEEIAQRIQKEQMLEEEKRRAEEEKRRAEEEIAQRIQKEQMLEEEKRRAEEEIAQRIQKEQMLEEEKRRAEEEIAQRIQKEQMLEEEKRRAEEEKRRAEEEKRRAEEEIAQRIQKEQMLEEEKRRAEEEKRRAEEEIAQRIQKEQMLEEEKRRAEEALIQERIREQIRAEIFEQEKRKLEEEKLLMAAQFEKEKETLLLRIQQLSGCAQA